ncbi:hypothetical protein ACJJTC_019079 [Scirpophaga incertulas]
MDRFIRSFKEWTGLSKRQNPEIARSHYSLVSNVEVTPGAVQLWVGLPPEIKNDPSLASLRQLYEKEHAKENIQLKTRHATSKKRLPLVSSAPHLNNNVLEEEEPDDVTGVGIEIPNIGNGDMLSESGKRKPMVGYILPISDAQLSVLLTLAGPFMAEQDIGKHNSTNLKTIEVWMERWTLRNKVQTVKESDVVALVSGDPWSIVLQDDEDLDFSEGEPRSQTIMVKSNMTVVNETSVFAIRMRSSSNKTTPLSMKYIVDPVDSTTGVIYACVLLCGLYILIIFEVINRTMAAVIVATTSLAVLAIIGQRPSLPEVISWLDVETLLLLFSMMLLVAIMAETGMFDYLAVYTFEVTKGKLWPLITLLCAITAVLSTVLDNVTTVLLMTPVTIRLCEVMDLNPVPILVSMVLFSNIGGTATPVGDPPNVIIASNKGVIQNGINFTNFTLHMTLGITLICVQTYFQLRYIYRDAHKLRLNVPREIQELRQQITIWRRAADSLPNFSKDEQVVRERLERKVRKLNLQLESSLKESNKRACPKDTFKSTLDEMKGKYKIRDKWLLVKATVAVSFVVAVFFLHSIPELRSSGLRYCFFASLFVLMEALSKLGLIEFIGGVTESLIFKVDEKARLGVAIVLMLWVSGVASAFVDNIPLTTMMVRVVTSLGANTHLQLPMTPLVWALSFGACLGGNGTLIGASANVVCAGVAEQHGYRISFMEFFKVGFPVMIGHLIIASGYLLLCHCAFTWH